MAFKTWKMLVAAYCTVRTFFSVNLRQIFINVAGCGFFIFLFFFCNQVTYIKKHRTQALTASYFRVNDQQAGILF